MKYFAEMFLKYQKNDENIPSERLSWHCIIACVGNEKDSEQVKDDTAQQPFLWVEKISCQLSFKLKQQSMCYSFV